MVEKFDWALRICGLIGVCWGCWAKRREIAEVLSLLGGRNTARRRARLLAADYDRVAVLLADTRVLAIELFKRMAAFVGLAATGVALVVAVLHVEAHAPADRGSAGKALYFFLIAGSLIVAQTVVDVRRWRRALRDPEGFREDFGHKIEVALSKARAAREEVEEWLEALPRISGQRGGASSRQPTTPQRRRMGEHAGRSTAPQ